MSIQQMLLGVGAKKSSVFVDDVFSTYLWAGNGTSGRTITNNIDISGEGALVWIKSRTTGNVNVLFDTERGANQRLRSDSTLAQNNTDTLQPSFTSSGFTVGSGNEVNGSGNDYTSWTFRKSPAFDVVTWTQGASANSNRRISHGLSSVPGLIMVKRTNSSDPWYVYHRSLSGSASTDPMKYFLKLNDTTSTSSTYFGSGSGSWWGTSAPSSTDFGLDETQFGWSNGDTFVAYIFAGGESNASEARSVDFDGTGDTLEIPNSSDYSFGSGDFTIEGWYKPDSIGTHTFASVWNYGVNRRSWSVQASSNGEVRFNVSSSGSNNTALEGGNLFVGQWAHFAAVRDGNTLRLFVNGIQVKTSSFTGSIYNNTNDNLFIGSTHGTGNLADGEISNLRIVKGTAVYTSSFKPPTTPLTSITNTKLLCCNNSSTTGSTTTSGTITANGDPTASSDSPFDDPAAHVVGESGSESVISCGSYVGNGSTDGPEIFCGNGWEPQWILLKCSSASENWRIYDSMRGIVTGGTEPYLRADREWAETSGQEGIEVTSTGFKLISTDGALNGNGRDYIYCCIRRSDGYVGKPVELGTGAFTQAYGNYSSGNNPIPNFTAGFPVDFAWAKLTGSVNHWYTSARLIQGKEVKTDQSAAESSGSNKVFDSNVGWHDNNGYNSYISHMWKRGQGFDCICFKGDGVAGREIRHNLGPNNVPEMIWVKRRDSSGDWFVYNKGLDGGTNPATHYLTVNNDDEEADYNAIWNDTAPTSTHFTVGNYSQVNGNNNDFIALLFSSVKGISHCGEFTGSGNTQTITIPNGGFQPRFIIIKAIDQSYPWIVVDSLRGWGSGNDPYLRLNTTDDQEDHDQGYPTSTGFVLPSGSAWVNGSGVSFLYYCHA